MLENGAGMKKGFEIEDVGVFRGRLPHVFLHIAWRQVPAKKQRMQAKAKMMLAVIPAFDISAFRIFVGTRLDAVRIATKASATGYYPELWRGRYGKAATHSARRLCVCDRSSPGGKQ
jgi:hypothetical protein